MQCSPHSRKETALTMHARPSGTLAFRGSSGEELTLDFDLVLSTLGFGQVIVDAKVLGPMVAESAHFDGDLAGQRTLEKNICQTEVGGVGQGEKRALL